MNDASKRKLAEIKARVAGGKNFYELEKECMEFLMMSLTELDLKKSDRPNDSEQYDRYAKTETANAVEPGNVIVRLKEQLVRKFVENN